VSRVAEAIVKIRRSANIEIAGKGRAIVGLSPDSDSVEIVVLGPTGRYGIAKIDGRAIWAMSGNDEALDRCARLEARSALWLADGAREVLPKADTVMP
jgi:hypothetical protein